MAMEFVQKIKRPKLDRINDKYPRVKRIISDIESSLKMKFKEEEK